VTSKPGILFDVDGTLVDTTYLHTVAWWEALRQHDNDVPMAEIHRAIGMGSGLLLDKLLPADRDKDADADIKTAHSALYSTYWSRLRPLPGAVDLLRACKRNGLTVVLASSADEPEFKALRAALDVEDAIDEATFAGDVEASKPAPDLVQVALEKAGVPAGQAVFTGDTVWDVEACRKAGVPCIGLLSGGVSRDELMSAGAAEVYPGPGDLLAALDRSLLGKIKGLERTTRAAARPSGSRRPCPGTSRTRAGPAPAPGGGWRNPARRAGRCRRRPSA
jgi:HAD superfamily hydrolase (TIGR01509 family)